MDTLILSGKITKTVPPAAGQTCTYRLAYYKIMMMLCSYTNYN